MASQSDRDFVESNNIFFEDETCLEPVIHSFAECELLPEKLVAKLTEKNFIKPTPIQAVSIPIILKGRDFVGVSETGSGKTLAFLIPALTQMLEEDLSPETVCSPYLLVVAPTRELAMQTHDVFRNLNLFISTCIYGGAPRYAQLSSVRSNKPFVLIGTPGRINDFLESGLISLNKCYYLVLDEADKMFDMGFYPQIKKIVDACPSNESRQTLLFSATWIEKIQDLANSVLKKNRAVVSIGPLYGLNACTDVKQHLFLCTEYEKKKILGKILREFEGFKVLVFTNTKHRAQDLAEFSTQYSSVEYIHGDVTQCERERIIKDFNKGSAMIIFATDVASRGLDIQDINVVVNFDFPMEVETYVHRIGRTGRNGKKGLAFTFLTEKIFDNYHDFNQLLKIVQESGNEVPENLLND